MTDTPVTPISLAVDGERQTSTNFFWRRDFNGQVFDLQTTIRDNVSHEMIQAHIASVVDAITSVVDMGGISKNVGGAPAPAVTTVATTAAVAPAPAPAAPQASAPAQPATGTPKPAQAGGALTFETATLLVTETNGKKMFKVTGGQWLKYGVTIWPEVLEKHTDIGSLQGGVNYDFGGYIATYALNDQGKPSKITKLEKVT